MRNTSKVRVDNTSGYPGVCYEPRCNKWRAYITIDKHKRSLGYFSNKEEAIQRRIEAEIKKSLSISSPIKE